MRLLTGLTIGVMLGATASILTRRYLPAAMWWLWTTDTREHP